MTALYNEIDPKAAAWLRALIDAGHIAPGIVNECSIEDLTPAYLGQFTQVHFFAGIGVWSYALRAAGWPDDRPVWTGSCPCQPFSAAGNGGGFDDERHLWPAFHWLIDQCRPDVVFGEQVASKDGLGWLDLVQADLEGSGYASGAVDLCAAGVGAPHIRQRLWWFGERMGNASSGGRRELGNAAFPRGGGHSDRTSDTFSRLGDGNQPGLEGQRSRHQAATGRDHAGRPVTEASGVERVADRSGGNPSAERKQSGGQQRQQQEDGTIGLVADASVLRRDGRRASRPSDEPGEIERSDGLRTISAGPSATGPTNGLWGDADWLFCRDGKWRPVEPGTFPLAHGATERVGRLRGYGNAIVAPAAQAFIEAYLDATVI